VAVLRCHRRGGQGHVLPQLLHGSSLRDLLARIEEIQTTRRKPSVLVGSGEAGYRNKATMALLDACHGTRGH
jgi:hypothetical protein